MLSDTVRAQARLVLPLAILVVSAPLMAQQPQSQEPQQREHVVRRGDTLWALARLYLGNPFLWPSIFEVNRNVVENPHWIYPAERLLIPPVQPTPPPVTTEPVAPPIGLPVTPTQPTPPPPVQEAQPVIMATVDLRRPIVPLAEYLEAPWVSATAEQELVGRIVQSRDPAAPSDRLAKTLHITDLVYIGQLGNATIGVGDSLVVVRFGRGVGDRGRMVEPLAIVRVDSVSPTMLTGRFARLMGDTRVGDAVLPLGMVPAIGLGRPEPVAGGMEGQLLEFQFNEPLHATTDLAFISLGAGEGVGIGDEFAVYVPSRTASRDAPDQLPPTDIATVRVVKVGDRVATVRVLTINSTALRDGLPVRLIRKMP